MHVQQFHCFWGSVWGLEFRLWKDLGSCDSKGGPDAEDILVSDSLRTVDIGCRAENRKVRVWGIQGKLRRSSEAKAKRVRGKAGLGRMCVFVRGSPTNGGFTKAAPTKKYTHKGSLRVAPF